MPTHIVSGRVLIPKCHLSSQQPHFFFYLITYFCCLNTSPTFNKKFNPVHRAPLLRSKIRPVAQISPSDSFVPLVNLVGVATPNPSLTGAERQVVALLRWKISSIYPRMETAFLQSLRTFLWPTCISVIFMA